MFKKILAFALLLGLVLGGFALRPMQAATDDWSGHSEKPVPFSLSITAGTPAVIVTAVTGKAVCVRRLVITNSASGGAILCNGAGGAGPTHIYQVNGIANTPIKLTKDDLGQGIYTTVGTGLFLDGTTGTISGTAFVEFPAQSPN